MMQDPLNQMVEDHDCATCPEDMKEGCTLKYILPVIKFTLDWDAEETEARSAEMNELFAKAEDVVAGAFALIVSKPTGGDTMLSIFRLLVSYGYIMGRKYVEVPKAFES